MISRLEQLVGAVITSLRVLLWESVPTAASNNLKSPSATSKTLLQGKLGTAKRNLVQARIEIHQKELMTYWSLADKAQPELLHQHLGI